MAIGGQDNVASSPMKHPWKQKKQQPWEERQNGVAIAN
jgi:hypothetical protein